MALLAASRWSQPAWWRGGLLFALWGAASAASVRDYQVKAVFLFNFAQFVEWPADAFAGAAAPLVIGVLGDDPFGPALDETVRGEKVGERPIVIRRFRRTDPLTPCHILFISQSESARLGQVLAGLQGRGILTVCDTEGFAQRGVMIRFINDHQRIRLRINLESVRLAGLKVSSKLLRPAEIVGGEKE